MERNCNTCAFMKGGRCQILTNSLENCFAWADEVEAQKRKKAVEDYSDAYAYGGNEVAKIKMPVDFKEKRNENRDLYLKLRKGKSVAEVLDEQFNWFYLQGKSDEEIATKLYVTRRAVCGYRNGKNLPPWNKKDRSAGTETVM